MSKSILTLVADIQSLFDGADLLNVAALSDKLGKQVERRFLKQLEERKPELYLSSVGKPLRQLWYDLKGFKGEEWLTPTKKMQFLFGDLLEELLIFLAREAGHTVEREQERVEVDGVRGKIDCIIDGVLVDVKSASDRSYDKFASGKLQEDDPFGYIHQLAGYSQALGNIDGAFLVINKEKGKIHLDYYTADRLKQFNVRKRIQEVRDAVALDVEPERCYEDRPISKSDRSGNRILATGCSYCHHRIHCWRSANDGAGLAVRYYSTGPKYFTVLAKEPRLDNQYTREEFPTKGGTE